MPKRFLEDIAAADIAFHAWDKSAFRAAADAALKVMVENSEEVQKSVAVSI